MTETTPADVRRVLGRVDADGDSRTGLRIPPEEVSVRAIDAGVNESYLVDGPETPHRLFVKFGTHSTAAHLRGGVAAYRLLGSYTTLPVPTVHLFDRGTAETPPVVVLSALRGASLADGFDDTARLTDADAVQRLGEVLASFARLPADATAGYGFVESLESPREDAGPRAVAETDDWAAWLADYGTRFFEDPPEHDAVAAVAPDVANYLRAHRESVPSTPSPSLVVTDISPENLLAADGIPPGTIDELTGVVDLERAKVGPVAFTAVNAEYLLTRDIDDPEPVQQALYEPLPFGPHVPNRDYYRAVAIGRSVAALDFWYEPGTDRYRERGDAIAAALRDIVG